MKKSKLPLARTYTLSVAETNRVATFFSVLLNIEKRIGKSKSSKKVKPRDGPQLRGLSLYLKPYSFKFCQTFSNNIKWTLRGRQIDIF